MSVKLLCICLLEFCFQKRMSQQEPLHANAFHNNVVLTSRLGKCVLVSRTCASVDPHIVGGLLVGNQQWGDHFKMPKL